MESDMRILAPLVGVILVAAMTANGQDNLKDVAVRPKAIPAPKAPKKPAKADEKS